MGTRIKGCFCRASATRASIYSVLFGYLARSVGGSGEAWLVTVKVAACRGSHEAATLTWGWDRPYLVSFIVAEWALRGQALLSHSLDTDT